MKKFKQINTQKLAILAHLRIVAIVMILLYISTSFAFAQPNNSNPKLDSLTSLLTKEQNDSISIDLKIKISREHHRLENHEEDIRIASKAIEQALIHNNTLLYAKSLDNLGLLYRYHQQYGESIPLHKKAFELIEYKDVAPINKMIFANNAGVASRYNSDYNTAVYYYLKALSLAEAESDLKNIEIACNGLGNTLIAIPNRNDEALAYLERALSIAKLSNNKLGMSMHYLTISDYYNNKGLYSTARRYLNELLQLNKERKDNYGIAMTYQSIGISYLNENKDLNTARINLNKALSLFENINDKLKQANVHYSLANILFLEQEFDQSLKKHVKSFIIARELKNKSLIMRNAEKIAQIYEHLSEPQKALAYYKLSQQYKDSINLSNQETEIAAINNRYNFEKKESEIELLKKDWSIQEAQLDTHKAKLKNRSTLILLMAFSLFSFILIVFLQKRNRKIRISSEQQLQLQEKEKTQAIYERNIIEAEMLATRMQVNPHFLFNSLNSIKYLIQIQQNAKAVEYLVIFSRFIRMILETSQRPNSTIHEELELALYYLRLEENRFQDDFSFTIENEIEQSKNDITIPTLLLQPIIENAIWHGLLPSENKQKTITIHVTLQPHGIKISIDDNGVGRQKNKSKKEHNSMGNKITKDRIELFNKSNCSSITYTIIDKVDSKGQSLGTCVELLINNAIPNLTLQKEHLKEIRTHTLN